MAVVAALTPKRGEPRKPYLRKIFIIAAIGGGLTIATGVRQLNQNDHPEVSLSVRQWDSEHLEPNILSHLSQGLIVSSATAKQAQFWVRAFVLRGAATDKLDHEAIVQFKKTMVDTPMQPQDSKESTNPYHYEEPFTFDSAQIKDLENGESTLYAMVYAEWQNKQGLILKYSNYVSMAVPTQDGYVANIRWHRLIQ